MASGSGPHAAGCELGGATELAPRGTRECSASAQGNGNSAYMYLIFPTGEVDAWPGQRERATAILLACRHLPLSFLSSPGQRAVLLAEAARTLEKVGDRRSCNDCQQMIVKLGGGTAIAAS